MQSGKRTNGVKRSVKTRVRSKNKRVAPSLTKKRKSVSLSSWLWSKIEIYCYKYRCNRSQAIERGMMEFLSKEINETIMELKSAKVKVAMLEQQIKNSNEIKELLEIQK